MSDEEQIKKKITSEDSDSEEDTEELSEEEIIDYAKAYGLQ